MKWLRARSGAGEAVRFESKRQPAVNFCLSSRLARTQIKVPFFICHSLRYDDAEMNDLADRKNASRRANTSKAYAVQRRKFEVCTWGLRRVVHTCRIVHGHSLQHASVYVHTSPHVP